jgi:hypothetical protein
MRSASATLSTCLPSADAFFRKSSDAVSNDSARRSPAEC